MAGLLDIFGTGGGESLGLLGGNIEQSRNDAQAQALYALAGSLLGGGPTGLSIVKGLQQGSNAYRDTMKGATADQMDLYKLQEFKRKQQQEQAAMQRQQQIDRAVAGAYQPAQQAQEVYGEDMMGQKVGEGMTEARAAGFDLQRLAPALMASPEGRKTLSELMAAQKGMQGETFSLAEGAQQYQRDPLTGAVKLVASGAPKKEATPAAIAEYNFAKSQGYGGTFADYEFAKKRAGASNVSVNTGEKSFATNFGKGVADTVNEGFANAQAAQQTLGRIASVKPLLQGDKVFSGPLANAQVTATRLADTLGVTGANSAEKLKNTSVAMQQLAGLELNAAEAMKGQGAITENERGLIKRAAGGDLMTMTAGEINGLIGALEKTSKYKIKVHESNISRLKQNKELAPLADYYQLNAPEAPAAPSGMPSGDAIAAEIARRRGGR